jgi:hypothetical protein
MTMKYQIEGKYIVPKSVRKSVLGETPQWYKAKLESHTGDTRGSKPLDLIIEYWPDRKALKKLEAGTATNEDKKKIWLVNPQEFDLKSPDDKYYEEKWQEDNYSIKKGRKEKVYQMTPWNKISFNGFEVSDEDVTNPVIEMESLMLTGGKPSRAKLSGGPFAFIQALDRDDHYNNPRHIGYHKKDDILRDKIVSGRESPSIAIAPKSTGIKMF